MRPKAPCADFLFEEVKELLYQFGTAKEVSMLQSKLPKEVFEKLFYCLSILDEMYGEDRDYFKIGGYCMVVETREDLQEVQKIFDYEGRLCEWVDLVGEYACELHLLGDDFSLILCLPNEFRKENSK